MCEHPFLCDPLCFEVDTDVTAEFPQLQISVRGQIKIDCSKKPECHCLDKQRRQVVVGCLITCKRCARDHEHITVMRENAKQIQEGSARTCEAIFVLFEITVVHAFHAQSIFYLLFLCQSKQKTFMRVRVQQSDLFIPNIWDPNLAIR